MVLHLWELLCPVSWGFFCLLKIKLWCLAIMESGWFLAWCVMWPQPLRLFYGSTCCTKPGYFINWVNCGLVNVVRTWSLANKIKQMKQIQMENDIFDEGNEERQKACFSLDQTTLCPNSLSMEICNDYLIVYIKDIWWFGFKIKKYLGEWRSTNTSSYL